MEIGSFTALGEFFLGTAIVYLLVGGIGLLFAYFVIRAAVRSGVLQALAERDRARLPHSEQ